MRDTKPMTVMVRMKLQIHLLSTAVEPAHWHRAGEEGGGGGVRGRDTRGERQDRDGAREKGKLWKGG